MLAAAVRRLASVAGFRSRVSSLDGDRALDLAAPSATVSETARFLRTRRVGAVSVIVAFLNAASAELADWSPEKDGAGILQCEIDSNEERSCRPDSHHVALRGWRSWRSDTHFNLQMAFERRAESVDSYAAIYVGEELGTETSERFLEWLSVHPTVGPVLDSVP